MHPAYCTGISLAMLTSAAFGADGDRYCKALNAGLEPGTLYVAASACMTGDCLSVAEQGNLTARNLVSGPSGPRELKRGRTYAFIYKTEQQPQVRRSMVVVQIKHSGVTDAATRPLDVRLARDRLAFGCNGFFGRIAPIPEYPLDYSSTGDFKPDDELGKVSHRAYDAFHRNPSTGGDEAKALYDFHVNYHNGDQCVATLGDNRRGQFLFYERDKISRGAFNRYLARLGVRAGPAVADELDRAQTLRVVLQNYENGADKTGCLSFLARTDGTAMELALSDLDATARSGRPADVKRWGFVTTP